MTEFIGAALGNRDALSSYQTVRMRGLEERRAG
jgi:hypothetical protein